MSDLLLQELHREWAQTGDRRVRERLIRELGRRGKLWATIVTGPYQKVGVRVHGEGDDPKGRKRRFFFERWHGPEGGGMDLKNIGPRSGLRQVLEGLRKDYGARSRILELREEWERKHPEGQRPSTTDWATYARKTAAGHRRDGVVGWNPPTRNPSPDERIQQARRAALEGGPQALVQLGRELNRAGLCGRCGEGRHLRASCPQTEVRFCDACAALRELGLMEQATKSFFGYLSASAHVPGSWRHWLATWHGFPLALVIGPLRHGRRVVTWEGQDAWGRRWYGRASGVGFCTNMRLYKPSQLTGKAYLDTLDLDLLDLAPVRWGVQSVLRAQSDWLAAASGEGGAP